jgi:hypothetical protein
MQSELLKASLNNSQIKNKIQFSEIFSPAIYIHPLRIRAKFQTHTKQQIKLLFRVIICPFAVSGVAVALLTTRQLNGFHDFSAVCNATDGIIRTSVPMPLFSPTLFL